MYTEKPVEERCSAALARR